MIDHYPKPVYVSYRDAFGTSWLIADSIQITPQFLIVRQSQEKILLPIGNILKIREVKARA